MAQRNSPSRRIPGEPLAGILRTVAYQARYSSRRRNDIPTVTNSAAAAESAAAESAATGVALMAAPESMADAMAKAEAEQLHAELQQPEAFATLVAATPTMPDSGVALIVAVTGGRATLQYQDRGVVPSVVATVVADYPAVATVSELSATSATVHTWGMDGQRMPEATVTVVAMWP